MGILHAVRYWLCLLNIGHGDSLLGGQIKGGLTMGDRNSCSLSLSLILNLTLILSLDLSLRLNLRLISWSISSSLNKESQCQK
jgi:hypothetical protein